MSVAKYPVDVGDKEGITDAVNYLLSGPSGLGQNFQGFADYLPAYLRPSTKQPWSLPITTGLNPSIYLALPINNAFPCDETGTPWAATSAYIRLDFTTPQATAPFQFGDKLDINNVVDTGGGNPPYSYNDSGYLVFSSTTTYVILTFDFVEYEWSTYISGGDVGRDYMNYELDTDCNARVTVEGATTQVFVSAQLNLAWDIVVNTPNTYNVKVQIKRFRGFPSQTPGSTEFLFADGVLISEKTFLKDGSVSGPAACEAIFTTVLDKPSFGYYWYILDVYFDMPGAILVETDSRNFTLSGNVDIITKTFTGISPTNVTGSGSGLVVDVSLDSASVSTYSVLTNTTIDVTSGGNSYRVGDILKILGTDLGQSSPANDMTLVIKGLVAPYDVEIGKVTTGLRSLTAQVIKQ